MTHNSLVNIFHHQDNLSFDQFALATLEGLMLLEREEYLKSKQGQHDSGNGTYLHNFLLSELIHCKLLSLETGVESLSPYCLN